MKPQPRPLSPTRLPRLDILPAAAYRLITIYTPVYGLHKPLSLYGSLVAAGFPSPADDHLDKNLDLTEYLVHNRSATFYIRVKGDSMKGCGIFDGAMLVVDRSLKPRDGDVVLAVLEGEFTCKRLKIENRKVFLCAENPNYKDIIITEEMNFRVWGVVTSAINDFRRNTNSNR